MLAAAILVLLVHPVAGTRPSTDEDKRIVFGEEVTFTGRDHQEHADGRAVISQEVNNSAIDSSQLESKSQFSIGSLAGSLATATASAVEWMSSRPMAKPQTTLTRGDKEDVMNLPGMMSLATELNRASSNADGSQCTDAGDLEHMGCGWHSDGKPLCTCSMIRSCHQPDAAAVKPLIASDPEQAELEGKAMLAGRCEVRMEVYIGGPVLGVLLLGGFGFWLYKNGKAELEDDPAADDGHGD
eukprot:gnl/TRDRNA2_/TRDRNA2_187040_c0_seq1.p1 gnl/TRDRNA2_/TRDRNA2_187040_c0~~gnl/TRDRNA2_/TRDRNA2_187040_c0_seq1.p1  ORF type:complete len:241 (-),score=46.51 gnl/TRDRNA2_/TRDRNA2_187040_c0_seq1:55-777(-)